MLPQSYVHLLADWGPPLGARKVAQNESVIILRELSGNFEATWVGRPVFQASQSLRSSHTPHSGQRSRLTLSSSDGGAQPRAAGEHDAGGDEHRDTATDPGRSVPNGFDRQAEGERSHDAAKVLAGPRDPGRGRWCGRDIPLAIAETTRNADIALVAAVPSPPPAATRASGLSNCLGGRAARGGPGAGGARAGW